MDKQFKITNLIGKGTFGKVYKAVDSFGNPVAVKKIPTKYLDSKALSLLEQEIDVMSLISHPNIVDLKLSIKTPDSVYMLIEYCEGGDLETFIKENPKTSIIYLRRWSKVLVETLSYMHANRIMHRDLKLANFLLTSKDPELAKIKIADFGFAKIMQQSITATQLGSPLYMAPEIFNCGNYTIKADIWSMGTVLYELLTKKPLFNCQSLSELIRLQNMPIKFPGDCRLPYEIKELILKMLSYQSDIRPDCTELLQNEFFDESNEEKYKEMEIFQKEYIFISSDAEEEEEEEEEEKEKEEENQDVVRSALEKSEYFEDSDEGVYELISIEINFFIAERKLQLNSCHHMNIKS
jgi:serine/threonine protein kinase